MTDREMLELAAKAAGIDVPAHSPWGGVNAVNGVFRLNIDGTRFEFHWNPLTDDGDTLLLAIAIEASMHVTSEGVVVYVMVPDRHDKSELVRAMFDEVWLAHDGDRAKATRLAITRAAAAIGKAMP